MDVQYGTWTDGPNKDVLWTSFGRAMPIGGWLVNALTFVAERVELYQQSVAGIDTIIFLLKKAQLCNQSVDSGILEIQGTKHPVLRKK